MHIKQVATLLGYGEPRVLEVFRNIFLTRLYWVLIPLEISSRNSQKNPNKRKDR